VSSSVRPLVAYAWRAAPSPRSACGFEALLLIGFVLTYGQSGFLRPSDGAGVRSLNARAGVSPRPPAPRGQEPSGTQCCRGCRRCPEPIPASWGCWWAARGGVWGSSPLSPSPQYFPGRPCVQTYLRSLDGWLRNWTEPELPRSALKEAMKNNRDVRDPGPCSPHPCPFPLTTPPAPTRRVPLSSRPPPLPCSPPT